MARTITKTDQQLLALALLNSGALEAARLINDLRYGVDEPE